MTTEAKARKDSMDIYMAAMKAAQVEYDAKVLAATLALDSREDEILKGI